MRDCTACLEAASGQHRKECRACGGKCQDARQEVDFFFLSFFFFKRLYSFTFRERGREGEREGEKHQCVVVSCSFPTGDLPTTQAYALTGNQAGDPLVRRPALNPLSHTSQGKRQILRTRNSTKALDFGQ